MPFTKGMPRPANAGRKKGTGVVAQRASVRDRLAALGYDPFDTLRCIASGDLACGVCRGKGKTRYQSGTGPGKTFERTCQSCYGSGKERIAPSERARAASELAKYCEPQLKAIEHTGSGGGPILTAIEVVMVAAQDGKRRESDSTV